MKIFYRGKGYLERAFHIDEIRESTTLQLFYITILGSLTISFFTWNGDGLTSPHGTATCMPHITDCEAYKNIVPILEQPYGYSENIFYVLLFVLIVGTAVAAYQKRFLLAHSLLSLLFLWKGYILFGITSLDIGNYDYYDMALGVVFLFAGNKLFYLRLTFVFLYFLSATVKFHDGWITGTYFTSLENGIPFLNDAVMPLATNLVILFQVVGCWCLLLPKRHRLFKFFFVEFLLFHFYSGTIVGYRYIITSIPPLIMLFAHPFHVPYQKGRSVFACVFLFTLLFLQLISPSIPGDQKLTLEGTRYGFYMFDANHQCVVYDTLHHPTQGTSTHVFASTKSRYRCEIHSIIQERKKMCEPGAEVALMILHSINGGSFYKIVDEQNICTLMYKPFRKNEWIRDDSSDSEIGGYAQKNTYYGAIRTYSTTSIPDDQNLIPISMRGTGPLELTSLQQWIHKHLPRLERAYWALWIGTGIIMLHIVWKERHRKTGLKKNDTMSS